MKKYKPVLYAILIMFGAFFIWTVPAYFTPFWPHNLSLWEGIHHYLYRIFHGLFFYYRDIILANLFWIVALIAFLKRPCPLFGILLFIAASFFIFLQWSPTMLWLDSQIHR